jgi:fatty-acyl-CoA synthase/long-chain acyl-CoA synthetase
MAEQVPVGDMKLDSEKTLDAAVDLAVETYGELDAVIVGDDRLTYTELGDRINRLAAGLYKLGVEKDDVVVLLLPTCLEFVYLYWAITKVGGVVAPVNPLSRRAEIGHILADSEAKAVVFAPNVSGNDLLSTLQAVRAEDDLPNLKHLIMQGSEASEGIVPFDSLLTSAEPQPPKGVNQPDDLWALLYTSGTTGLPKGVMHTHRTAMGQLLGVAKMAAQMRDEPLSQLGTVVRLTLKYGTRYVSSVRKRQSNLSLTPLYATGGHYGLRSSVLMGYLYIAPTRFHPVHALEIIEREHVGSLVATPSMYRLLLDVQDFDKYDKSSLLVVTSSMAYMPPDLAERVRKKFKCPLMIAYGSTEGGAITGTGLGDTGKVATDSIGHAIGGSEVKIVDDKHNEVSQGQVGEIAVKSAGIMAGYYKAPHLTADVLDDEGWYYTGDVGMMDAKGVVKIVGRKKDMIIRGGQNIFPPEIENHINGHPAVLTSAVVGVPSEIYGETVWAFVVPTSGQTVTPEEISKHCRGVLSAFKVPSEVRIIDELPMAAGLKVQKYKLRARAVEELEAAGKKVVAAASIVAGPVGE